MGFVTRYWKQIVCSIVGAWFYLTSLTMGVDGLLGGHLFADTPLSGLDWLSVILIGFEVFPFYFSPASNLFPLAVILWIGKGWLLGFGVCHWYRKSLRFESIWLAIGWWFCCTSFSGCVALLLISTAHTVDITDPDQRDRIAYFSVRIFALSCSPLVPIAIGLGFVGLLKRLLASKENPNTDDREGIEKSSKDA